MRFQLPGMLYLCRRLGALVFAMGMVGWRVLAGPPENDQFSHRIPVVGTDVSVEGTVAEATIEPGEPHPAKSGGHSLWWSWTPEADGLVRLSGRGIISVYQGDSLGTLLELSTARVYSERESVEGPGLSTGETPDSWMDRLIVVKAGVPYSIRVDSDECTFRPVRSLPPFGGTFPPITPFPPIDPWNPPCVGLGTNLWFRFVSYPAASDSYAGRHDPTTEEALFFGRNDDATREPGEPDSETGLGRSIWWSWTVPARGWYTMDEVEGRAMSVAVFRGDRLDQLERVADRIVSPTVFKLDWISPRPMFFARAGEKLAIRGDSLPTGPTRSSIAFRFHLLRRPVNDDFVDALVLTNLSESVTDYGQADFGGATPEPGEDPAARHSAWWRWTAPSSGDWVVGSSISVYLGDDLAHLTPVELNRETNFPRFSAVAGQTYMISKDPRTSIENQLPLQFRFVRVPFNDDQETPLDLTLGADRIRLNLDNASVTSEERGTTDGYGRSVWLRWRAPSDGYLVLRPWTWFNTRLVVGTEAEFAAGVPTLWNASSWVPATIPVNSGATYLISVLTQFGGAYDSIELAADFTSWRLTQPLDGTVFPGGTTNLVAGLTRPLASSEAAVVGVSWAAFSPVFGIASPTISGDRAEWPELPSGLWAVHVILTNEYQRTLPLPPVTVRLPPRNDDLASAERISGFPWLSPWVSTVGAGLERGEPQGLGESSTHSLWWTWTPEFDGTVMVSGVDVTGVGAAVAAFEGTELAGLKPLNSSPFAPLRIATRAGVPLSFQVTPNYYFGSPGILQLAVLPQLPGDDFESRIELPELGGVFPVPVGYSSVEPEEPRGGGVGYIIPSLWWTWVPPADGTLILEGEVQHRGSFDLYPFWRAFSGGTLKTLKEMSPVPPEANAFGRPTFAFEVRSGEQVQLAGTMFEGTNAAVAARLEFVPHPAPGSAGRIVRTNPLSGPAITFPVTASAGERVVVEFSRDCVGWSEFCSRNFEQAGTAWVSALRFIEETGFLRVRWEVISP